MTRKSVITEAILGKEFARAESATGRNVVSDWSPNNIKTIIFGWKKLYIEYHVCNKLTKKHGISQKMMVHSFTDKQVGTWELKGSLLSVLEAPRLLSAVEEVYLLDSADYPRDIFAKDMADMNQFIQGRRIKERFPRLYAMGKIRDTHEHIKAVTDRGRNNHLHYAKVLTNVSILYNNTNWWRYGNGSNAPLRPAYYAFDTYPDKETDEILPVMLLHRCFTEVAKPYWEAEIKQKNDNKQQNAMKKAIDGVNERYKNLDLYLNKLIPAAGMADLLYQCNRVRQTLSADKRNHCLKIRSICNMVRDLYIYNRAGRPVSYRGWQEEHSSTSAIADDKLYDTYRIDFTRQFKLLGKIIDNDDMYKGHKYSMFTDLLTTLRYVLYPVLKNVLLSLSGEADATQLSIAVLKASRFDSNDPMFLRYSAQCYTGVLPSDSATAVKPTSELPDTEMVQFIVDLCVNFCYAVVYAEMYSLHTEVNVRLNNPNAIVKNLLWNTNLYINPETNEPPVKFIYYDNTLLRIARAFATSMGTSDYKTLADYIPNIGAIKFDVRNGETVCVPEPVTRKYDNTLDAKMVLNGLHALTTLLQSVQYEQGLGMTEQAQEQNLVQYLGNWHKIPIKQFSMLINNGIRLSKTND